MIDLKGLNSGGRMKQRVRKKVGQSSIPFSFDIPNTINENTLAEFEDASILDETQATLDVPTLNDQLLSPTDESDLEWRRGRSDTSTDDEDDSNSENCCDEPDIEALFGEYYDSDEAGHICYKRVQRNEDEANPNSKMPIPEIEDIYVNGKIILRRWLRFRDHKHFGDVLKDYAIQEGFELRKVKHARSRVTSMFKAEGCTWRIHASLSPDGREFIIKTLNPQHKCQCVVKNRVVTSGWIAKKLHSKFANDPKITLNKMRTELKDNFGIEATNRQLWKARQKARGGVGRDYAYSYGNLR
uniref:Transposase MuDR plant domain-containing protein n=1 Tax=Cannabis sativa TaxID=3483 RepID=A0A803QJI5_CANSA